MRTLLYFDAVEIIRANDEEVERFAVQIGNDTIEARKAQHHTVPCRVLAESGLSENTLRILRHIFKEVRVEAQEEQHS